MDIKPQFEKTKQILRGLELLYPDQKAIPAVAKLLKNIVYSHENSNVTYISDLIDILGLQSIEDINLNALELKALLYENDPLVAPTLIIDKLAASRPFNHPLTDLRKVYSQFLNHGFDVHVYRFLYKLTGLKLINNIAAIQNKVCLPDLHELFSKGQLKSKLWLVEEIKNLSLEYSSIQVHCGWYALHAFLLHKTGMLIHSFDKDHTAKRVAMILNQDSPNHSDTFTSYVKDVYEIDNYESGSLVINTSCEHLSDFSKWYDNIPKGTLVALQSNNFFDCDQHSNCVENLEDFMQSASMSEVLYSGELDLPKYTRFMLIGIK